MGVGKRGLTEDSKGKEVLWLTEDPKMAKVLIDIDKDIEKSELAAEEKGRVDRSRFEFTILMWLLAPIWWYFVSKFLDGYLK